MKASELRIGNYFYLLNCNEKQINIVGQTTKSSINVFPLKVIEPIPLTEEWLVKFGFKNNKGWFMSFGFDEEMQVDQYYVYIRQTNTDLTVECFMIPLEIKYVHQLQNLYYALTGNELVII